jgi:hypothetical protein
MNQQANHFTTTPPNRDNPGPLFDDPVVAWCCCLMVCEAGTALAHLTQERNATRWMAGSTTRGSGPLRLNDAPAHLRLSITLRVP